MPLFFCSFGYTFVCVKTNNNNSDLYRWLIMGLQVIANFSIMPNLREDDMASGATDYDGEKYSSALQGRKGQS